MSIKKLTLSELINEHDTISINNNGFNQMSGADKRKIWSKHISARYPNLCDCYFCGSDANSGLGYLERTAMISWHNSGSLAEIECKKCGLRFTGVPYLGHVVDQWNSVGNKQTRRTNEQNPSKPNPKP